MLAFNIRPYRLSSEQSQTLFGSPPRAAFLPRGRLSGASFTAAIDAALSEVLPWRESPKVKATDNQERFNEERECLMSEVTIDHTSIGMCGCPACSGNVDEASLDPLAGGTANNKPIWTPEQIAAYLNRTGGQWGDGTNDMLPQGGDKTVITYGFHENQQSLFDNGYVYSSGGGLFGLAEYFQFGAFTRSAARRDARSDAELGRRHRRLVRRDQRL